MLDKSDNIFLMAKNFTRKDLSKKIYRNLGFSKNISLRLIDDFFESMLSGLLKTEQVKISSFGTFQVIKKKERMGRNPKTGIEAKICARKVVRFKPSISVKNKINNNET